MADSRIVAEPQVFNEAEFLERLMDDRDLAATVINVFLKDIPAQLRALRSHLDAGDSTAFAVAHSIKGAASTLTGSAMAEMAFKIEEALAAGDPTAAHGYLIRLESEFEVLRRALNRMLGSRS